MNKFEAKRKTLGNIKGETKKSNFLDTSSQILTRKESLMNVKINISDSIAYELKVDELDTYFQRS